MNAGAIQTRYSEGLTRRQSALIAGFAYLLMPVMYAEFYVFPTLLKPGHIDQTAQNIVAHTPLFLAGVTCHLITLIFDVIIAWALFALLSPVNRAVSLLAAWFRIVYTVIALSSLFKLTTVVRLLTVPYFRTLFGDHLLAQVQLLLSSFRYEWSMSLVIFGIHLVMIGWLITRSDFIPKSLGGLIVIVGLGWVIYPFGPYLYPYQWLDVIPLLGFGELALPLWLVVRGWKLQDIAPTPAGGHPAN